MRLRRIQEEFGERVHLEWRSFLLRPQPDPGRTLEKFRAYTRSWLRPAGEPDAPPFHVWESAAGPPSHSVPPHLAAKAAGRLGEPAFARLHAALLHAYFTENRDITDADTLLALWRAAELPEEGFQVVADPQLLRQTIDEHNEAIACGVTGVPALRVAGRDGVVIGAQPLELYRRWFGRCLAA